MIGLLFMPASTYFTHLCVESRLASDKREPGVLAEPAGHQKLHRRADLFSGSQIVVDRRFPVLHHVAEPFLVISDDFSIALLR